MKKFTLGQEASDKYGQLWTIQKRTAKMVTAYGSMDGQKRFKILLSSDCEYFKPYGTYSQAPCVFAG